LFAWPNSRISVMSGDAAAGTLWTVGQRSVLRRLQGKQPESPVTDAQVAEAEAVFKKPILAQYARESDPYFATARLWDDGILDPVQTRMALALAFSVTLNAPFANDRYGTFRM
jgi:3-methylcrotonyl-CoA carboxylase beta subunit